MLALKYFLMVAGVALFGSVTALLAYDVYLAAQLRRLLGQQSRRTSFAVIARIPPRAPLESAGRASARSRRAA